MSITKQSDEWLLSQLKNNDRDAFSEIYRRYWQVFYDTASKRTKSKAHFQDIIQNIFTDLWQRRHQIDVNNLPVVFTYCS